MSQTIVDDQSSRLKQFQWEELDDGLVVFVIFRSTRRYVVRQHFEIQLSSVKSPVIAAKWRRLLSELVSEPFSSLRLTLNETKFLNEISSWHLNNSKIRFNSFDVLLDFDVLLSMEIERDDSKAMRKKMKISSPFLFDFSSSTGWIEFNSKLVPFIRKQSDRFLAVEFLFKENLIDSFDDLNLRCFYVPIQSEDVELFHSLIREKTSSHVVLNKNSSVITLDHFLFRSKRFFYLRFLSSPNQIDPIDFQEIMSNNGGLLLIPSTEQRIPFVYLNNEKWIPQFDESRDSNSLLATKNQLEYFKLIVLYDYLSSEGKKTNIDRFSTVNQLMLIPVQRCFNENSIRTISFNEFQRRFEQEKKFTFTFDPQWWLSPQSIAHFKLQRPIFF